MAETDQNFTMYQNKDFELDVPISDKTTGNPLDLTGCTINWALRQRTKSTTNLIVKSTLDGITINGNVLTVKLVPNDTASLVGSYYHECEMIDTQGLKSELFTGDATILFSNL